MIGCTDANFLGHFISPAGLHPNAERVSALTNMPIPPDVQQVRALMGGVNYYRIFLPDLSKRLRPINALPRRGVMFAFTPAMENWCGKSWQSSRPRRSSFSSIGRCRRQLTPVSRVLRRLHRRVRRCSQTGADERLHKTHRVYPPSYARLGRH